MEISFKQKGEKGKHRNITIDKKLRNSNFQAVTLAIVSGINGGMNMVIGRLGTKLRSWPDWDPADIPTTENDV